MIIRAGPDGLTLIRQTEHARICGDMARAWGSDDFAAPAPPPAVALAAAEHDNGWTEWEDTPLLNPRTHQPYRYGDIPIDEHLPIYRRGIARAIAMDPYAGLLVSLHGSRLYSDFRAGQPGADAMLAEQRDQQERLRAELKDDPDYAPYVGDRELGINSDLIFGWDILSLFLCHGSAWTDAIEFPAGRTGERQVVAVTGSDETWALAPFPFRETLDLRVSALEIAPAELPDPGALRQALDAGREVSLRFALEPG